MLFLFPVSGKYQARNILLCGSQVGSVRHCFPNLARPVADYRCEFVIDELIMQEKPREEMQRVLKVIGTNKQVYRYIVRSRRDRTLKVARVGCRNASNSAPFIEL